MLYRAQSISQAKHEPMELRRESRYRLDAPALFSWESAEHGRLQAEGITRDISVFGAFILTPTCPPVDVPIQVEVFLPSLTGLKPVIRVIGAAHVVRVERHSTDSGGNGFAIVSKNFSRWNMLTERSDTRPADAQNAGSRGSNGHR